MKTYKKKELAGIITSLEQINSTIINNLGAGPQVICDMLAQCQEAAITVGNALEHYGEVGLSIINVLEDYCENLYQLSLSLEDEQTCVDLVQAISHQLQQVNRRILEELPADKKEVVFLPYKASMWDSLESVWKAAIEDADCEVYVVPIPYFDRNTNGTLGEMHYEGDQYPDYVPITSWKEYNIAVRKPDVIYIHNPYDHCNRVTSVHPDFYAVELCKYTDMLVYIPYFVAIDDNVEKHFCVVPGVRYAHKVIVQSEKVRQTYIQAIREFEEQNKCRGAFGKVEEKILALGSPKYDKVLTAKREDFEIPEEWERLIVRPDGSRKKVVLYNTTIEAMLRNTEQMIVQIDRILSSFATRKDAVLLWRPHPLLKTTLSSMRSNIYERYTFLEEKYIKEGRGIFDDSADLYRAITISDAYYGDWSSVAELYKYTGKKMMIQKCDAGKAEEIILQSFCTCNGKQYASSLRGNGLFMVEEANQLRFIDLFPGERIDENNLFVDAIAVEKYVFFVPGSAKNIHVYDTEKEEFIFLQLETNAGKKKYSINCKFSTAVCFGKCVFLLPETYPAIVKIDCDTWEIFYIDDWVPDVEFCFKKGIAIREETVIVPSVFSNIVMHFDMREQKAICVSLKNDTHSTGIWSVVDDGTDFWGILYPGPGFVKIDQRNECCTKDIIPENFRDNGYAFSMSFIDEGYIYACPVRGNMVIRVECQAFESEEVEIENLLVEDSALMFLCKDNLNLYFCRYRKEDSPWRSENLEQLAWNVKTKVVTTLQWKVINSEEYGYIKAFEKDKDKQLVVERNAIQREAWVDHVRCDDKVMSDEKAITRVHEEIMAIYEIQ